LVWKTPRSDQPLTTSAYLFHSDTELVAVEPPSLLPLKIMLVVMVVANSFWPLFVDMERLQRLILVFIIWTVFLVVWTLVYRLQTRRSLTADERTFRFDLQKSRLHQEQTETNWYGRLCVRIHTDDADIETCINKKKARSLSDTSDT
jgi:hypothetical protein